MSRIKDLAEFAPLPGLPGYLVHPDGRVASVKKDAPVLLKVSQRARPHLATVRLGRVDVRVRDLTYAMFGRDSRWGW